MKKITLFSLFGVALLVAGSMYAKDQRIWKGDTSRLWDLGTPNWSDPNSVLSFLPTTTVDSATAIFDDNTDSLKVKVVGVMIADSILVNSSKDYSIDINATGAEITGKGILIKKGTGTFTMNVKNSLLGGSIVYDGRLNMLDAASPNIFGAKLKLEGGIINGGTAGSTSSKKSTIAIPIEIPAGKSGTIELARYSYLGSKITGSGSLNLLCAGERTFLGYESLPTGVTALQPDWSEFTGDLKVSKLVTSTTPGFWGLLLNTSKTFKDSLNGFGIDSTFYNKRVTIGSGATLATHSGTKAWAIGELNAEDSTSNLSGYRSQSNGPRSNFFVGGLNTSVVYPGRICQAPGITSHYTHISFIKMGTGTYTLTNNKNDIIGGLIVRQGRILINDKNLKGRYDGGAGGGVIVRVEKNGTIGGTGRISTFTDVYGKLEPGADGIGTLTLSDSITANPLSKYGTPFKYSFTYKPTSATSSTFSFQNGGTRAVDLILREGSVSEFEIANVNSYDKVIATGKVRFSKDTLAAGKPKIKIRLVNGAVVIDGDKFEIIKAKSLDEAYSGGFDIEYPVHNGLTWSVETKADTTILEKETLTFTNKVTTYTMTDSMAVTNVVPDTMLIRYRVIVTAHGGTGVNDIEATNFISMYPNPSKGDVNFMSTASDISSIEIINLQGQTILRKEIRSTTAKLELNKLTAGIYYAKIVTSKGTKVEKLMIQ